MAWSCGGTLGRGEILRRGRGAIALASGGPPRCPRGQPVAAAAGRGGGQGAASLGPGSTPAAAARAAAFNEEQPSRAGGPGAPAGACRSRATLSATPPSAGGRDPQHRRHLFWIWAAVLRQPCNHASVPMSKGQLKHERVRAEAQGGGRGFAQARVLPWDPHLKLQGSCILAPAQRRRLLDPRLHRPARHRLPNRSALQWCPCCWLDDEVGCKARALLDRSRRHGSWKLAAYHACFPPDAPAAEEWAVARNQCRQLAVSVQLPLEPYQMRIGVRCGWSRLPHQLEPSSPTPAPVVLPAHSLCCRSFPGPGRSWPTGL